MKTTLLIYAIATVIFEIIHFVTIYMKYGGPLLKMSIKAILSNPQAQKIKKMFWNWYGITFFLIPLVILICQVWVPYFIFKEIKKIIVRKSKLMLKSKAQKLAEAEMEDWSWHHKSTV